MDSKQLLTAKQHLTALSTFIVQLSTFYEGIDPAIDGDLRTLRGQLSGSPDFILASLTISKIQQALQHNASSVRQMTKSSLSQLEQAIKQLQPLLKDNDKGEKQALQLLVRLSQPLNSLFTIVDLSKQTLTLFQEQLTFASNTNNPKKRVTATASESESVSQLLQQHLIEELYQLIDTYGVKHPNDTQLTELKRKISTGMREDELVHACILLIRMIVRDAMDDASMTGKVIQSLHQALGNVGEQLEDSKSLCEWQAKQRAEVRNNLRQQVQTLHSTVSDANDIEQLKISTSDAFSQLNEQLRRSEDSDLSHQTQLLGLLTSMQQQVTQLQQQAQRYKKRLTEQLLSSQTDPLTRLPNRQAYNDRLRKECERAKRHGYSLALAVVDIDFFKNINDKYGHSAGDKTLQVVGKKLKSELSDNEFLARWGGEEFVILLPYSHASSLPHRLNAMRSSLAELPFKFKDERVAITASFGAALLRHDEDPEKLFERADKQLYKAKRAGRNCVMIDPQEVSE